MATRKKAIEEPKNGGGIVINEITVAQLNRGNQNIQTWFTAIQSAESERSPNRRPYYNTCRDISIDLHLKSLVDKRTRAVTTTPFEWTELNDNLKEHFGDLWFMELRRDIMSWRFEGTTLIEFTIGPGGIAGYEIVPRQNVKPEKGIISIDGYSDNGFAYREGRYVNYIIEVGGKRDLGLFANVAPYVLLKRQNLADFARYNEMFGMPLRVYYYDHNMPGARGKVTQLAKEYGSAAYIVLPKGFGDVQFQDSVKQSTAYAYDKLHQILNDEMTIGILGQLLTTGGKEGGSYSLGQVHKSVEEAINLEDRLYLEIILNYKFRKNILIPHGYPMQNSKGAFKLPEALPIEKKAEMWIRLATEAGLPIAEEDFYNEFGVPFPDGRPVVVAPSTAPKPEDEGDPVNDDPAPDPAPPPTKKKPNASGGGSGKKSGSAKLTALSAHYASHHPAPPRKTITASYKSDLDALIKRIIKDLRAGTLKPGDVDPQLWEMIGQELFTAVEKGYGMKLEAATGADEVMLRAFRQNVYRFSGFKVYHFVQEANRLLVDENGKTRPFADFKRDILSLNNEYNVNHLRTEYNHAVGASRMASKWQQFKADKELFPYLQVDVVMDDRTRHGKYNKIIAWVGSDFWKRMGLPPWDYNCRCNVRQLADAEVTDLSGFKYPEHKKGFGVLWGEEPVIFPADHPQFEVNSKDQPSADKNFGLPIPE